MVSTLQMIKWGQSIILNENLVNNYILFLVPACKTGKGNR